MDGAAEDGFPEADGCDLEQKRGAWRGWWHAQNCWRSMERYACRRIGRRQTSEINTAGQRRPRLTA